ncbi:MAG: hypothetical protein MUF42_08715 [Cytophagaceae bacterium]|jgi:hypothetical protein|nr:hypothetical protein [Cytophagaceae bacterium]
MKSLFSFLLKTKSFVTTLSLLYGIVLAQTPGMLDPDFADAGINRQAYANATCIGPDGKIISGSYHKLYRVDSDGNFDLSFGVEGVVTLAEISEIVYIDINASGKIAVRTRTYKSTSEYNGKTQLDIYILNPDGSLDAGFNGTGRITMITDGYYNFLNGAYSVQIDDNNNIYFYHSGKIYCLNSTGNYNESFGTSGSIDCSHEIISLKLHNNILYTSSRVYHNQDASIEYNFYSAASGMLVDTMGNSGTTSVEGSVNNTVNSNHIAFLKMVNLFPS